MSVPITDMIHPIREDVKKEFDYIYRTLRTVMQIVMPPDSFVRKHQLALETMK
jgi:hypothetical protein